MIGELLQFAAWRVSSNTCLLLSLHTMWGFNLLYISFVFLQIAKYISPSDSSNNVSKLFLDAEKYCRQCENIVCVSKYQIVFVQIPTFICPNTELYLCKYQIVFVQTGSKGGKGCTLCRPAAEAPSGNPPARELTKQQRKTAER